MDRFQLLVLGGSVLLVLVQSIRGWRLGVARQAVNLAALALAYLAAIVSGRMAMPILHRLGYPELLMSVAAGSMAGWIVYRTGKWAGRMLFGRTGDQTKELTRLGYGLGGAALGMAGALVTVWLSMLGIRCLGTVAEAEVNLTKSPAAQRAGLTASPIALELTWFKQSLDAGMAGAVLKGTDPVPDRIYLILNKIAQVISSEDSMQRFVTYPGTKVLSQNPKIVALQTDPQITRQVERRDFVGLMANPKIVAVVNDPALEQLVRRFELEKALDYALTGKAN